VSELARRREIAGRHRLAASVAAAHPPRRLSSWLRLLLLSSCAARTSASSPDAGERLSLTLPQRLNPSSRGASAAAVDGREPGAGGEQGQRPASGGAGELVPDTPDQSR
jgi:hypothetical protein